jgi:hypothetical protein
MERVPEARLPQLYAAIEVHPNPQRRAKRTACAVPSASHHGLGRQDSATDERFNFRI